MVKKNPRKAERKTKKSQDSVEIFGLDNVTKKKLVPFQELDIREHFIQNETVSTGVFAQK